MISVTLKGPAASAEIEALVDSGADVNVLPWSPGLQLGLHWNPDKATLRVRGASGQTAAMPVLLALTVPGLSAVTQAFAWTQTDAVPFVLGQTNFFMEFDVCFFRSRLEFSIVPKSGT